MSKMTLLGDEAVAIGAMHAGLSSAYGYPGTPSTEIMECLLGLSEKTGKPHATWCTNEKTACEEALGASMAGKRALVTMKHVGLNVAADPFMNAALIKIHGGLVLAVADDPGMHSSQDEQDSRYYADFARTMCLEPATQQEAYEMTREAYEVSEKFHIPILLRLVTRLAHSRAVVEVKEARAENPLKKAPDRADWILMPANARRRWHHVLEAQKEMQAYSENSTFNSLTLNEKNHEIGVITTGIAKNYYFENLDDMSEKPSHLHIGVYPVPVEKIRKLAKHVKKILFLEEGYPFVERMFRGLLPLSMEVMGKESGHVPAEGELNPEIARKALGLPPRKGVELPQMKLPQRPPQLCAGCPHIDSYTMIKQALSGFPQSVVTADIGCYTLGALPPYSAIESCVCMGASITTAKGAAEAGLYPVVAVLGDSTFLHSGITGLIDAVSANTPMTVMILDNEAVAMTGGQTTILPSSRLQEIVRGVGVNPEHFHVISAHRNKIEENLPILRREFEYKGLSVIIAVRECLETAKRKRKKES